jgi:uncharacterized repeat protein (TIGR03803 family)
MGWTESLLCSFGNGSDGSNPYGGLIFDQSGNLYGATGNDGGTVFKLTPGGGWTYSLLYSFTGVVNNACGPGTLVMDRTGSLYGTTASGGDGNPGYGVVFKLQPAASACKTALCPWTETVLCTFQAGDDGANPNYGDLIFDKAVNIYGATYGGDQDDDGTVYELTPSAGGWTENVLFGFDYRDGQFPYNGVILDNAGNLYGTTSLGGAQGYGTVFQLTPSGPCWTQTIFYNFQVAGEDGGVLTPA